MSTYSQLESYQQNLLTFGVNYSFVFRKKHTKMLPHYAVHMMTSSNGNVTGPLCGEFTAHRWIPPPPPTSPPPTRTHHTHTQRPVKRSFDAFFDLRLNKWLSKHSWDWWFETSSCPLWRHCSDFSGHMNKHDVEHVISIYSNAAIVAIPHCG